jgi:hypothetical protein
MAAIGGPPSSYFYNSYEVDIEHNGKVRTIVENILIQITVADPYLYIINVLTGDYISVPSSSDLPTIRSAIDGFLKATYHDSKFDIAELKPIAHAAIKEDYLFTYFLERCNPLPILPVNLGQARYFIKAEIEDEIEDEVTNYSENTSFNQSAFEEDVEAPQTLISQCDYTKREFGGDCKFIDPILRTSYDYDILRTTTYIEKSKEDYDKIIDRLKPISIPPTADWNSLNASIIEKLGSVFDVNNKPVAKVIDVIQENFGKHISLDVQLKASIDNPPATNIATLQAEMATVKASATPPVPLLDQISDNIDGNEYFKVISFLRSYIDLFHDITIYGKEYCEIYYNKFIEKITSQAKTFLDGQIKIINESIFTRTGNINQERCREQIERIADLFIRYLHENGIKTNPIEKESARIMSASIDNKDEMESLIATLKADGIEGFYVESANNNIGEILSKVLPLYNLTIGDWDAGSGFTGKSLKKTNRPQIIQVGPAETRATVILPNMPIDMFGLFRVEVSPDNKILSISYGGAPLIEITPRQKLSVNALLIAAGKAAIRGTDDVNPKKLEFKHSADPIWPSALTTLKPWTDLVQIKTISRSKIITVIYDILCETTARMFAVYHTLLCQGKILTYYSYNINSRNLKDEQIQQRILLRYFIKSNADWIKRYLTSWFTQKINTLQQLIRESYDPTLFFISKAFINRYIIAGTKSTQLVDQVSTVDIKSIPDTLDKYIESVSSSSTLLADLLELYSQFNTAIIGIDNVGTRGNKEIFLNAYKQTQQLIVNTFKTGDASDDPIILRAMIACTFAYYFIKNPRYSRFLTKLDDIKQDILFEQFTYTRPLLNEIVGVKINAIAYNPEQLNASLPKIKLSNNEAVRNIVDIQIAIQILLTTTPSGYQQYIQQVSIGKIPTNPAYSFDNAITHVTTGLNSVIASGTYFGGNKRLKKLSKTRKQKRTKRKTYKKRK